MAEVTLTALVDELAHELVEIEGEYGVGDDYVCGFRDALDIVRDAIKRKKRSMPAKNLTRSQFFNLIWCDCHQIGQQKAFGLHMENNDTYVWDTEEHYYRLHFSDDFHATLTAVLKGSGAVAMHKHVTRSQNGHGGWKLTYQNAPDDTFNVYQLAKIVKEDTGDA